VYYYHIICRRGQVTDDDATSGSHANLSELSTMCSVPICAIQDDTLYKVCVHRTYILVRDAYCLVERSSEKFVVFKNKSV